MKSWAWAAICISIASAAAMGGVAGCSSDDPAGDDGDDDGEGGNGSGGTGAGNTPATGSGTGTGTGTSTSTGPGGGVCDDLPCNDPGEPDMDPNNDCVSCSFAGDEASDAGTCGPEAQACFDTAGDECLNLNDCILACPEDDAAFLDCLCTNDGTLCNEEQDPPTQSMAGTCFGDHPTGVEPLTGLLGCINGVCATACM